MLGSWPTSISKKRSGDVLLYVLAIAVCIEMLDLVDGANDVSSGKASDENPQIDNDYAKRGWKTDLPMWGKRGWQNLHSGWGKRDLESDEDLSDNYPAQIYDKRTWQRLQGGWGKRFIPSEDDLMIRQLAAALEDEENDNNIEYYPDQEFESSHEVNKRNWRNFNDGWGKRSNKWEKFRGSWGKRQPAWNNLKGLWGKRSIAE